MPPFPGLIGPSFLGQGYDIRSGNFFNLSPLYNASRSVVASQPLATTQRVAELITSYEALTDFMSVSASLQASIATGTWLVSAFQSLELA